MPRPTTTYRPASGGTTTLLNRTAFVADFRRLAPELHAAAMAALEALMAEVADKARVYADEKGFSPPGESGRGTGALIGGIRHGVTKHKGYVVDKAVNKGVSPAYPYPKNYEFGNGGARAFMRPAINDSTGKIYAGIDEAISAVITRWN